MARGEVEHCVPLARPPDLSGRFEFKANEMKLLGRLLSGPRVG